MFFDAIIMHTQTDPAHLLSHTYFGADWLIILCIPIVKHAHTHTILHTYMFVCIGTIATQAERQKHQQRQQWARIHILNML